MNTTNWIILAVVIVLFAVLAGGAIFWVVKKEGYAGEMPSIPIQKLQAEYNDEYDLIQDLDPNTRISMGPQIVGISRNPTYL